MTRQPRRRRIQRLLTTHSHFIGERISGEIDQFVGITAAAAPTPSQLDRHEPMHVRVLERKHQATGSALAAWLLPNPWCFAMNQLGEPQRETLFPDPLRPGKQHRLR